MIYATGYGPDGGRVNAFIGLSADDLVALGAGGSTSASLDNLDPRLPAITVTVFAGATDEAMMGRIQEQNPDLWRIDQLDQLDDLGEAGR